MPRSGELPANAPAIAGFAGLTFDLASDAGPRSEPQRDLVASVECTRADGTKRAVDLQLSAGSHGAQWLKPQVPWTAGETCTITGRACDLSGTLEFLNLPSGETEYLTSPASFHVTEPAPMPTRLGELSAKPASKERLDLASGGACVLSTQVCSVHAELTLSADAEPWKDALVYWSTVDGKPWRVLLAENLPAVAGNSYAGRAKELFYSTERGQGLAVGPHVAQIHAALPGSELTLDSNELHFELDCGQSGGAANPALTGAGGCSAARAGGGSERLASATLVLAAVFLHRRRRRSRCSGTG